MPTVRCGDADLYYEVHGEGPPLMLIAGLGGVGAYWHPQIEVFSKRFKVIIHDHRGTGCSTHSHMQYSVELLAQDTLNLMDAIGIEKAHFVGHSTGGAIAQILAIEHPERLLSMVQYASWTKADPHIRLCFYIRRELLQKCGRVAYVRSTPLFLMPNWWIRDNEEALREAEDKILEGFPEIEIANSRIDAVLAFDRTDELNAIEVPTLVLAAKDDILTPPYFSEELAKRIPAATLIKLERGGHACSQTVPEEFNREVLAFLMSRTSI